MIRLDSDPDRWAEKYGAHNDDEPEPPCTDTCCDEPSLPGELVCRRHKVDALEAKLELVLAEVDPADCIADHILDALYPDVAELRDQIAALEGRR